MLLHRQQQPTSPKMKTVTMRTSPMMRLQGPTSPMMKLHQPANLTTNLSGLMDGFTDKRTYRKHSAFLRVVV